MTETSAPPAAPLHRFERPTDSPVRGVCTALAELTGTDAVLWRVLFVVTSFFGGLGIVLYLLGIVAIPAQGEPRSTADRLLHGPDRRLGRGQLWPVVLLVIVASLAFGDTDGLLIAAVLGVLALLWWRGHDGERPSPWSAGAPPPPAAATAPGAPTQVGMASPVGQPAPGAAPWETMAAAWQPRPARPRSPLTGLTLSLAALVAGVMVLIGLRGGVSVPGETVLAISLGVVGLGLVVGSWWGRATGLVLVALVLGLALAATAGARPALDAGVGDRAWSATSEPQQSFRLGVGEAVLDLSTLRTREVDPIAIDARVDVGHLVVLVPPDLRVAVSSRVGLGELLVGESERSGRNATLTTDLGPPGAPQVRLDLSVRTGQVEVRRG